MTEHRRESKIPCTLVQDLLPLYMEQLTSAESDHLLQEHLASCQNCQKQESLLRSAVAAAQTEQNREETAELNYLKKLHRSGRRKLLFGILAVLALAALLCGIGLKLYVFGFNAEYDVDKFSVQPIRDSAADYTVHIEGRVTDKIYCRYKLVTDSEGNDNLKIYARLPLPWERKEDVRRASVFDLYFNSPDIKGNLTTPDYYIGPDNSVLSALDRQLFEAKNPYVGDMPANMRLAGLIIGTDYPTAFENELQTDEEPYSWTLHFTQPLKTPEDLDYFERTMPGKACLLLALIDNLDEVRWTCLEQTENGNVKHEGSMNTEEATVFNGSYIKDCAGSPYEIHLLQLRILDRTYDIGASEKPDE